MFENISKKLKAVAITYAIIGMIAAIIVGVWIIMTLRMIAIGFFVIFWGCVMVWITSMLIYGFAELIENTNIIKQEICKLSLMEEIKKIKNQDKISK